MWGNIQLPEKNRQSKRGFTGTRHLPGPGSAPSFDKRQSKEKVLKKERLDQIDEGADAQ